MPLGFKTHHKNRSTNALNGPAVGTGTGTPSSGSVSGDDARAEAARERTNQAQAQAQPQSQPQPYGQLSRTDTQPYPAQTIAPDHDPRNIQQQKPGEPPSRSQSTRFSSGAYQHQPPLQSQLGGSADDLLVDPRRYQQPSGTQTLQPPPAPEPKKRSIFDRMRTSSNRHSTDSKPPPQASYNNTTGLGRRLSKKDQPPVVRTQQQNPSLEQQRLDWQAAQDSRTHLPSPLEAHEDDGGLDPYLDRGNEQGGHQPAVIEANYPQTIRTVQSDAASYHTTDERQQQFDAQQQHLREQLQQQHVDLGSHNYYQSHLQQPQVNISPASAISTNDPYRQHNPETVSQISYESPVEPREEQQRPVSVQSNNGNGNGQSPIAGHSVPYRAEHPNRTTSVPQGPRPQSLYSMAPQPTGANARRSADPKQTLQGSQGQGQGPAEPPPNYSRGQFANNQPPAQGATTSSAPSGGPPGTNYRGGPPQREQSGVGGGETGRNTPPPPATAGGQDIHELYKEISTKYKKVKGLYFEKTAQVEQLQNTLANQRLSQSRTSLDDSEYMTRFQRLEGAITNLAFNIRKDWRAVPVWISQYVNQDALKIGKQEMTAVGRACITKFLVDEIFNKTFHPGLDPELSISLKIIEQNIRLYSPALNNLEESEALTAKVVQWRLTTLEGLRGVLSSQDSEVYKLQFARHATTNLTGSLISFLSDPVSPGLEDSAHMIVELAVGIASNIPLESRDISVLYPMPGDMLQPLMMKIENPIPPLEHPGAETGEGDSASTNSGEKDEKEAEKSSDGKGRKEKASKSSMLSGLMGGASGGNKKPGVVEQPVEVKKLSTEDGAQKVRFAGFVSVEVRGRQVLAKAPVWTVS